MRFDGRKVSIAILNKYRRIYNAYQGGGTLKVSAALKYHLNPSEHNFLHFPFILYRRRIFTAYTFI